MLFRRPPVAPFAVALAVAAAFAAAEDSGPRLGDRTGGVYDVSFRPFAGAKKVDRTSEAEQLRFTREDKRWTLSFERAELPVPTPLVDTTDATGTPKTGYLTALVNGIRSNHPQSEVLRNELLDFGSMRLGMLTVALKVGDEPALLQQAVIEIAPDLYYSLAMTSPAPEKGIESDPAVQEAVAVFKAVTDSIERVDLSKVRRDQEDRLFRTRALFVEWNRKKLLSALRPEQMLRYRKDGKDIGYAYVVEQPADALPRDGEMAKPPQAAGVRVGTRSRSMTEDGKSVDLESWLFTSFDRKNEVWSNVNLVRDPAAAQPSQREVWFTEVGASDAWRERKFDADLDARGFKEAEKDGKLPYTLVDRYRLTVRTEAKSAVARPLERDLPPWYVPQAVAWLMPRLVPLNRPTGYLFATYQSGLREVVLRYVDVGAETDVTLGGRTQRAVPVIDRIGPDGGPTTHYYTPKGEFLGTVIAESGIEITPTDRATLEGLWKNSNLAAPGAVKADVKATPRQ
jgi:hypothetical protein